ncbi:MAG: hypothetical protein ACLPVO_15810 [Desulfomonilaceae bacterium]
MLHQMGLKLRTQMSRFSGKLCEGMGKIQSRFVGEAIYGIQAVVCRFCGRELLQPEQKVETA